MTLEQEVFSAIPNIIEFCGRKYLLDTVGRAPFFGCVTLQTNSYIVAVFRNFFKKGHRYAQYEPQNHWFLDTTARNNYKQIQPSSE